MSNSTILREDEEILDEQDRLADIFAQFLEEGDEESMSISITYLPEITKQLRVHGFYYAKEDENGRQIRMKARRLRELKQELDPEDTQRLDFVRFTEKVPTIVRDVKNSGELDQESEDGHIDTKMEVNQEVEEKSSSDAIDMDQMAELDEIMAGDFSDDDKDLSFTDSRDASPDLDTIPKDEMTKKTKTPASDSRKNKANSVKSKRLKRQATPPKVFDFEQLTSSQIFQIEQDLKLFTRGQDRAINLKDLIRVARMVDGDVIGGQEFYSEDSDDDDKEREINQEMPKLLQQHNKVQMKPPHINELIDMLQLHAPKNSSEKSEISLQDFANIMYMADLL